MAPAAGSGGLTVTIWTALDRRAAECGTQGRRRGYERRRVGSAAATRPPAISFEFFPPKSDAQAAVLDETVARLAPLPPALRVGHLRRRRHVAGALARHRARACARSGLPTAAHLTCAGASRDALGETIARFRGDRHRPLRGAPRRSAGRPRRALRSRIRTAFSDTAELVAALKQAGADRGLGLRLSGAASAQRRLGRRDRHAEAQGRCRRRPRDHPVLLRQRSIRGLSSSGSAAPASPSRSCPGIMPIHRFASICGFAEPLRRIDPGEPGAPLRRPRPGRGDAPAGRGGGGGRADGRSDAARRRAPSTSTR